MNNIDILNEISNNSDNNFEDYIELSKIQSVDYEFKTVDSSSTALSSDFSIKSIDGSVKLFWIKKVKYGFKVYELLNEIYSKLEINGLEQIMPRPIFGSDNLEVLITEKVIGAKLLNLSYFYSTNLYNFSYFSNFSNLFYKLGSSIFRYHDIFKDNYGSKSIYDITEETKFHLESCSYLSGNDKSNINNSLQRRKMINDFEIPLVKNHNDITLRNIILNESKIYLVDWDTIKHTGFTSPGLCLTDFFTLYFNILSIKKISPISSKNRVNILLGKLVKGYFTNFSSLQESTYTKMMPNLTYLFLLRLYLGIHIDRPLNQVYSGFLSRNLLKRLKLFLITN